MCCVVGYIGKNHSWASVLEGLKRLEYRGYDSAGFACLGADKSLSARRALGGVENLIACQQASPVDGSVGIGHTRWSTHGVATLDNAHPLFDCTGAIAVVHNGIIENHHPLRADLVARGHRFSSRTDSEVIVHLFEELSLGSSQALEPVALMQAVIKQLEGAYAFAVVHAAYPRLLFVARKASPLCLGRGADGFFVASDARAFAGKVDEVFYLPDATYALVFEDHFEAYTFAGDRLTITAQPLDTAVLQDDKEGYDHYMVKEIYEQPRVLADTVAKMRPLAGEIERCMGLSLPELLALQQVVLMGCGSSYYAGRFGQFFFEYVAQLPTVVGLASEYKYAPFFMPKHALAVAISQSGETADTLEVMRMLARAGVQTAVVTNVPTSSMARETGGCIALYAGQEVAVASTKAFSAQVATLFLLAHMVAWRRSAITHAQLDRAFADLLVVADGLEQSIERYKQYIEQELAPWCTQYSRMLFLGRQISFVVAQEAALKLKEIAYIFAEAIPAGELKHGPLALVDAQTPVWIFSVLDHALYTKLVANAQEVKARGGIVIAFAFEGQDELIELADKVFVFAVVTPLLGGVAQIGVMQYVVYCVARELRLPIDKPRNLAKSVTVE